MKKITLFLVFTLLITPSVAAASKPINNLNSSAWFLEFDSQTMDKSKHLTFEEAVHKRMQYENITYEEALNKMTEEENQILQKHAEKLYFKKLTKDSRLDHRNVEIQKIKDSISPRSIINYVSVEKEFSYSKNKNYRACLEAELQIYQDTDKSYFIEKVVGLSSRRVAGNYSCNWIQSQSGYDILPGKKSVYLWVKGYFEVVVNSSSGGTVSIPGFSVSSSLGSSSIYQSDTIKGTKKYYVK